MKLSDAVAIYIKLRDQKAQMKAEFEAQVAPIQDKMDKLEGKLLEVLALRMLLEALTTA